MRGREGKGERVISTRAFWTVLGGEGRRKGEIKGREKGGWEEGEEHDRHAYLVCAPGAVIQLPNDVFFRVGDDLGHNPS